MPVGISQRRSADLRQPPSLLPPVSDLLFCSTLRVLYARSLYSRRLVDHPDRRVSGNVRTQRIAPDHFDGLVRWLVWYSSVRIPGVADFGGRLCALHISAGSIPIDLARILRIHTPSCDRRTVWCCIIDLRLSVNCVY